jgi:hypothetical protein
MMIKCVLKKQDEEYEMDSGGLKQGPISVSSYEHGNETPSSIKGRKFLDELRDRQLFSNSATLYY